MTISIDAVPKTTIQVGPEERKALKETLLNSHGDVPLAKRFRALFTLKSLGDEESVEVIAQAFHDPSALLKHELAYVLGQMRNKHAIPFLNQVVENRQEEAMVRHEAAEALGAIADASSIEFLQPFTDASYESERVVRETCELAVAKIQHELYKQKTGEADPNSPFLSVDPAPATKTLLSTKELGEILMNTELSLFERYKAMFSLRNQGTQEAVLELAKGFQDDSALFRHEIAYVFGQLQHEASVPSLIQTLSNPQETPMVRHECAEALGSIATPECLPVLEQYKCDENNVVKDSCIVGLDMLEYEQSGTFQYADGLMR